MKHVIIAFALTFFMIAGVATASAQDAKKSASTSAAKKTIHKKHHIKVTSKKSTKHVTAKPVAEEYHPLTADQIASVFHSQESLQEGQAFTIKCFVGKPSGVGGFLLSDTPTENGEGGQISGNMTLGGNYITVQGESFSLSDDPLGLSAKIAKTMHGKWLILHGKLTGKASYMVGTIPEAVSDMRHTMDIAKGTTRIPDLQVTGYKEVAPKK